MELIELAAGPRTEVMSPVQAAKNDLDLNSDEQCLSESTRDQAPVRYWGSVSTHPGFSGLWAQALARNPANLYTRVGQREMP